MDLYTLSAWSSIVSLAFSVSIAIIGYGVNKKLNKLRNRLYLGVKLSSKIRQIEKFNSDLLNLHNDIVNNFNDIKLTLAQLEETIQQVHLNVSKEVKEKIKSVATSISTIKKSNPVEQKSPKKRYQFWIREVSTEDIYEIYTEVFTLSMRLKELEDNNKKFGNYE